MTRRFDVLGKREKYRSPWLVIQEYEIQRDDDKTEWYAVAERANAAVVLVQSRDGQMLFLKQYRFPTQEFEWEVPMGAIEDGETPRQAAERELLEETGLEVQLSAVGQFYPAPGLSPQRAHVFRAEVGDEAKELALKFDKRVDEIVDRRWLSRHEIKTKLAAGEISDGFTISALALLELIG